MALKDDVAKRIRDVRRRRGMTLQTLAELIGRSQRWLIDVELGRGDLELSELERIAERLRIDVAVLILGSAGGAQPSAGRGPRQISGQFGRVPVRETHAGTRIGGLWFPWVVCGYGPYRSGAIESYFHPAEPSYPPEIDDAVASAQLQAADSAARGAWFLPDYEGYKLLRFHTPRRLRQHDDPRLVLHFAPTTFYRALVTDQILDEPFTLDGVTTTQRQRFAEGADLRERPVRECATLWGVACAVITSDGALLMAEQRNVAGETHVTMPPVVASAVRSLDADAEGAPDHAAAVMRAARVNLGVEPRPEELTWLSIGASSKVCAYSLLGRLDTQHSIDEIEQRRSLGLAEEGAKMQTLLAVDFTPRAVAEFCAASDRRFSAVALATAIHALMSEFGVAKVEEAFGRVNVTLANNVPAWLDTVRTS